MNMLQLLFCLLLMVFQVSAMETEHDVIKNMISETTAGTLYYTNHEQSRYMPALAQGTDVQMEINGMIARVKVTQEYINSSASWMEGIYVFPLPENAAVDRMKLHIGKRVIEGKIKERQEAKKIYNKARQSGKRTSLVEQERPDIFTTSVANIGPDETIRVEIEYLQVLRYVDGVFNLRFPMVVAPRYIPGHPVEDYTIDESPVEGFEGSGWAQNTDEVIDASRITPPVIQPGDKAVNPVNITIDLVPGFPVEQLQSSYHRTKIKQINDEQYRITLASRSVYADSDFELSWRPQTGTEPQAALFRQKHHADDYALLMLMPPVKVAVKQQTSGRELVFVLDVSGSMHGESIEQAKQALKFALARLSNKDSFNVIWFNDSFESLYPVSMPVTDERKQLAIEVISKLSADGGTEMLPALSFALQSESDSSYLRQIVFLTDGSVGNEEALFNTINKNLANNRLFTIGIGSAPGSHFMSKAAQLGRGTFTYIGKVSEVNSRMKKLLRKLEYPALTDLSLESSNSNNMEVYPDPLPDLYAGEPLLIKIRSDQLQGNLTLQGMLGSKQWSKQIVLDGGQLRDGISTLWARSKIASLLDQQRTVKDVKKRKLLRSEVVEVALSHHLVSPFTSLVAVDVTPARIKDVLHQQTMRTNLPKGWDYKKVFGIPQTATPSWLLIMSGLLFLLLALCSHFLLNRRVVKCA